MTYDEIDQLWFRAMEETIRDGGLYTRYRFTALIMEAILSEHGKTSSVSTVEQPEELK